MCVLRVSSINAWLKLCLVLCHFSFFVFLFLGIYLFWKQLSKVDFFSFFWESVFGWVGPFFFFSSNQVIIGWSCSLVCCILSCLGRLSGWDFPHAFVFPSNFQVNMLFGAFFFYNFCSLGCSFLLLYFFMP